MKVTKALMGSMLMITVLVTSVFASRITVDYDHSANFVQYKTYSIVSVQAANPFLNSRIKAAIEQDLAAKGWTEVPSGGQVSVVAMETTRTRQQVNTFYEGFGGWRWGGVGDATTTVEHYKVGTLAVNMFDASSHRLIWRGTSSSTLTGNADKNTKNLNKDVQKMFKKFPPKANA
jgi:hypothetical protein